MKFFDPKKKENNVSPVDSSSSPFPHEPAPAIPANPVQPPTGSAPTVNIPIPVAPALVPPPATVIAPASAPRPVPSSLVEAKAATTAPRLSQTIIGSSLMIKGSITAEEDLLIDGAVDGTIETNRDVLVGNQGNVRATIRAANVIVSGRVIGDVTVTNKVDLRPSGVLQGNIRAPRLSIAETSLFRGKIDMNPPESAHRPESQNKTAAGEASESATKPSLP